MTLLNSLVSFTTHLFPLVAAVTDTTREVASNGTDVIWIFANISYAGMRAQNSSSAGWRILAFIFGFPGTLLSLIVITEGSERMYGIAIPRRIPAETTPPMAPAQGPPPTS